MFATIESCGPDCRCVPDDTSAEAVLMPIFGSPEDFLAAQELLDEEADLDIITSLGKAVEHASKATLILAKLVRNRQAIQLGA